MRRPTETDVDCSRDCPNRCGDGLACAGGEDCGDLPEECTSFVSEVSWDCDGSSECGSGFCVLGLSGTSCTYECAGVAECDAGSDCMLSTTVEGDERRLCVPRVSAEMRHCMCAMRSTATGCCGRRWVRRRLRTSSPRGPAFPSPACYRLNARSCCRWRRGCTVG